MASAVSGGGEVIDHRTRTVQELVDTEGRYVSNLAIVCDNYVSPLRRTGMLSNKSISRIFSNIETLLNLHRTFHGKLRERLDSWSDTQRISDVFLELTPYFKLYTQYCMNHEQAVATVQHEKAANEPFSKFLISQQQNDKLNNAYITTYLIMPIQRIPRYNILLEALVKRTPDGHPDKDGLQTCLQAVNDIAHFVNQECIKVLQQQELLALGHELSMDLGSGTRQVVRKGAAQVRVVGAKAVRLSPTIRRTTVALLSDAFAFSAAAAKKGKANEGIMIDIRVAWCFADGETDIHIASEDMTVILAFENGCERDEWLGAMKQATAEILKDDQDAQSARERYSLMKVNEVYMASSMKENKTPGKAARAAAAADRSSGADAAAAGGSKKRHWFLELGRFGRRRGTESRAHDISASEPSSNPLSPRRSSAREQDVAAASSDLKHLLDSVPEVDVSNKRRSMPHFAHRKINSKASLKRGNLADSAGGCTSVPSVRSNGK